MSKENSITINGIKHVLVKAQDIDEPCKGCSLKRKCNRMISDCDSICEYLYGQKTVAYKHFEKENSKKNGNF